MSAVFSPSGRADQPNEPPAERAVLLVFAGGEASWPREPCGRWLL